MLASCEWSGPAVNRGTLLTSCAVHIIWKDCLGGVPVPPAMGRQRQSDLLAFSRSLSCKVVADPGLS